MSTLIFTKSIGYQRQFQFVSKLKSVERLTVQYYILVLLLCELRLFAEIVDSPYVAVVGLVVFCHKCSDAGHLFLEIMVLILKCQEFLCRYSKVLGQAVFIVVV